MGTVFDRWKAVQERIADAAARAGSDPAGIRVVAVTKTRSAAEVEEALEAGLTWCGENRVQEAQNKKPLVRAQGQWHLIGRLQTNKAARAVELFDMVQSVDRLRVAEALERRARQAGKSLDILVQVNTSGAVQQGGVAPDAAEELVGGIVGFEHLRLRGLMTIGVLSRDERAVRRCFSGLVRLRERLSSVFGGDLRLPYLSMGMSGDFEWAIAEGANVLRLGTVLFGPRPCRVDL